MKTKPAAGAEGHLIWCGDGKYRFRVYNYDNHTFIDYDLAHSDLLVKIIDEDATFYNDTKLDHNPETLGLK